MNVAQAIGYQRDKKQREATLQNLKSFAKIVLVVERGGAEVVIPRYFSQARAHILRFMKTYGIQDSVRNVCEALVAM